MPEELPSVETGPNTPSNDETSREEAQPTSSDVVDSNTAYIKGWPLLLVIMVLLSLVPGVSVLQLKACCLQSFTCCVSRELHYHR